jgi:hypothetical protein
MDERSQRLSEPACAASRFRVYALLALLAAWPVSATAQIAGGALVGVLKDQSGGVLPKASVTATNLDTNQASRSITSADGYYEFPLLPAGRYHVEASASGFQPARTEAFDLHSGTKLRCDLGLALARLAGSVDVVVQAAPLNTTTTALGVVMNQKTIEALPLNGRNFQQLVGLQAGVINAPASATGGRGGIEFNGSPALGNNLLLDGVDMSFGEHGGAANDTSAGAGAGGALINTSPAPTSFTAPPGSSSATTRSTRIASSRTARGCPSRRCAGTSSARTWAGRSRASEPSSS